MMGSKIIKMPFGRSGHESTRVIFGGYALHSATQREAEECLELLLAFGINHIDTARLYGEAERHIGNWMDRHRDQFFLATKTRKRFKAAALADLRQSLKLLKVDQVDLWQIHGLTGPTGWETAMGPGGVLEACQEARQKGKVRLLGVTGHGTRAAVTHKRSLEHFDFDAVLVPYNFPLLEKKRYAVELDVLADFCRTHGAAFQTIKSIARRPWKDRPRTYNTNFYEPLESQQAIDLAVHWVLGCPEAFLITPGDLRLLPKVLDAASRFEKRPPGEEMEALVKEQGLEAIFQ